jgi:hypothetical protein
VVAGAVIVPQPISSVVNAVAVVAPRRKDVASATVAPWPDDAYVGVHDSWLLSTRWLDKYSRADHLLLTLSTGAQTSN